MPTNHDALGLWAVTAFLAAYLGLCIAFGRAPGRTMWIKRSERPGVFWTVMCLGGVGVFVLMVTSLYATLPELPKR